MRKVILCLLIFLFSIGTVSAFSFSGGGDWKYYKEITIKENSGKTLTNYQILVELNSANFDFSKAKSDGSDIRFSTDSQELSYWIEEWDSNAKKAKIWVKVPLIPANGQTTIEMWYGNPSATSSSNGDAVFELFDDFEGTNLNASKWSIVMGSPLVSSSNLFLPRDPTTRVRSIITFPIPAIAFAKIKKTNLGSSTYERSSFSVVEDTTDPDNAQLVGYYDSSRCGGVLSSFDTYDEGNYQGWHCIDINVYDENYHNYEITITPTTQKGRIDDCKAADWFIAFSDENEYYVNFYTWDELYHTRAADMYIDYVYARKYTYPEPTISISAEYSTTASSTPVDNVHIPYSESYEVQLKAPNTDKVFLVVKARIDWPHLAGAADIMQVNVNGNAIVGAQLVNKGPTFTYADGRTFPYYNMHNTSSWTIFYSPDFTSNNIAQSGYRVIEGNAYTYKFDVTGMVNKGQMNTVTIRHSGPEYISSIPDITTKTINEIKSTKIVVKSVYFVGEGEEYPTTAPTLTPPTRPPEGKIKAVWLYDYDKYDLPTLMKDIKSAGINTIFLSTDVNNIWKYERFVKTAHENGIEVHAMMFEIADNKEEETYDYTNFYKNPYHKDEAVKDVEKILDYNEKSLAAFDGINIDIEPYTSDLWNSNREDVWNDYMEVINAIKEKINGRTKLSANILYDSRDYTEDRIKDLASVLDFFVIMAYDSGGSGFNTPEEIKDAVAQEMGSIRGEGAKAVIGIGVHEGFGDKSDVENCINDLFDYYSDDPAFLGISIFRYYSYSELPETKKTPEENRQTGEEKEIPGFECIFAITLLAVAYMLKRLKK